MDNFSNSVLKDLVYHFPELQSKHNPASDFLELVISPENN